MDKSGAKRDLRPNRFLYGMAKAILTVYVRLWLRLRVRRSKSMRGLKPPFVVIANHTSSVDFALVAIAMNRYRLNIVTATALFYDPFGGQLLRRLGCIPKLQMIADPASVRLMMRAVREGGVLCLFPHGHVSYDGKNPPMPAGAGKLLRHLQVPVVLVKLSGAHLSKPKWAKRARRGRVFADVSVMLTPGQLKDMTVDEAEEAVRQNLSFNEYDFSRENRIPYACRNRAKGLERLLYQCPKCHTLYQMQSRGDNLACTACNYGVRMDEFGLLHPLREGDIIFDDPIKWVAFEREMAQKQLSGQGMMRQRAALYRVSQNHARMKRCGEGTLELTVDETRFTGEKDGEPFAFCIQNNRIAALPFSFRQDFWEAPGTEEYYQLVPFENLSLLHMALGFEAAQSIREKEGKIRDGQEQAPGKQDA